MVVKILLLLHSCSSFKVFRQLYENYLAYAEEDLQPLLLPGDYINTEVALPISVISENLPVLRVSSNLFSNFMYRIG